MRLQRFKFLIESAFIACNLEHEPWKLEYIEEERAKHSGFITELSYKNWEGGVGGGRGRS